MFRRLINARAFNPNCHRKSLDSLFSKSNLHSELKFIRNSSLLYPATSQRWDDAMTHAETIVGDASNFSNLQKIVGGEFNKITQSLQKLIGTNHPMLETAKRCTYISEGKMGSAQARGLTVILTAKAVESLANDLDSKKKEDLIRSQISLAEMTEMTYSAYMIHRGVIDLKLHGLESVDFGEKTPSSIESESDIVVAKGIHYGNKVSVLCGDFLLAYVMRGLGDLFSSKAVDLVASSISEFMEGEFMLIDDWRAKNYLMSENSRDANRWERRSYSTIGSLQGNTCQATLVLAGASENLQIHAREFGKNLGLAWQAHTEVQPFLNFTYEPIELPEMSAYPAYDLNCLPVVLFMRDQYKSNKRFLMLLNEIKGLIINGSKTSMNIPFDETMNPLNQHRHQEQVDYRRLHELILDNSSAVDETYEIIRKYSLDAISHLEHFPPSEAKDVLRNICGSLYRK